MPKVCIYLPDRLHAEVRRLDLPLSSLAQEAVERAVADDDRARWLRSQQLRTLRGSPLPRLGTEPPDRCGCPAPTGGDRP